MGGNGEALALSKVTIPGPVNAAQGKLDFLLGRVGSAKSESRGAFFQGQMGFDDATLDAALRQQLVDNFSHFPAGPAMSGGELGRLRITAPITGPSGTTSKVTSVWSLLENGRTSLITAW